MSHYESFRRRRRSRSMRRKTADPIKVEKAQYPFKATLQPGEAGVPYRALFTQESLGRKIASRELKSDKDEGLAETLCSSRA